MATTRRSAAATKRLQAYRRLFSTDDGKLVLEDLMKSCYVKGSVVGKDPYETYYNEGARSVVLRIMQTVGITEAQIKQIAEEMDRREEEEQLFI